MLLTVDRAGTLFNLDAKFRITYQIYIGRSERIVFRNGWIDRIAVEKLHFRMGAFLLPMLEDSVA